MIISCMVGDNLYKKHPLHEIIESCNKCIYIDKPPCIYRIYEKFLPRRVKTLVISESPPPGLKKSYIYNLNYTDRLRRVLAKAFNITQDKVINLLLENSIFWTTAIKCRPPTFKHLEVMRRNCLEILRIEIEILKPKKIIALGKRVAWKSVDQLNIKCVKVMKEHHPLHIVRFKREKLPLLKKIILDP